MILFKKYSNGFVAQVCILVCLAIPLKAQEIDPNSSGYFNYAPVFSQQSIYGSARMQGLAGAGVSLGGDIGQVPTNPASLGVFRKSEMVISAGIGSSTITSNFIGNSTRANKTWFGIPNFGIVLNFGQEDFVPGAFRGGSLGISFTKINDYQENVALSGVNTQNSISDYFVDASQGTSLASIQDQDSEHPYSLQALAYNSYLTEYDANTGMYYRPFYYSTSRQRETISKKAGQYSWDISYGANINDRLYLGIGGTMLVTNYKIERVFEEKVLPVANGLDQFSFYDNDSHRGTGFAAKLGAIFKVTDWMRIGGSFHTPTYNYITETYSFGMTTQYDNVPLDNGEILTGTDIRTTQSVYKYRFVKPLRLLGGLTFMAGKRGFITADVEYVPYSMASLHDKSDAFAFAGDNVTIKNIYQNALNYKIGAEAKLTSVYSLRAGASYNASPYKNDYNIDRATYYITGGVGARFEDFYVDFAVVQGWGNQIYKPYTLNNGQEPTAVIAKRYGFYQITTGIYF